MDDAGNKEADPRVQLLLTCGFRIYYLQTTVSSFVGLCQLIVSKYRQSLPHTQWHLARFLTMRSHPFFFACVFQMQFVGNFKECLGLLKYPLLIDIWGYHSW